MWPGASTGAGWALGVAGRWPGTAEAPKRKDSCHQGYRHSREEEGSRHHALLHAAGTMHVVAALGVLFHEDLLDLRAAPHALSSASAAVRSRLRAPTARSGPSRGLASAAGVILIAGSEAAEGLLGPACGVGGSGGAADRVGGADVAIPEISVPHEGSGVVGVEVLRATSTAGARPSGDAWHRSRSIGGAGSVKPRHARSGIVPDRHHQHHTTAKSLTH
mmetsp:Transcript_92306/g.197783  ORF Transcript_92306/g.197783 Transcript_92306/m.197783 type:complete len:219 (+) Transcript_92306:113-769(+)